MAAVVLNRQGVDLDAVAEVLRARLPEAADSVPELIPFDANTKKVLERLSGQALRLGHNYVGTEHLLLALLDNENGVGVFVDHAVTTESTEPLVLDVLASLQPN